MSNQVKKHKKKSIPLKFRFYPVFYLVRTKSSENDGFYPIFVVSTGTKSSEKMSKKNDFYPLMIFITYLNLKKRI